MSTRITTADARKKFSNIINHVAFGKESIILMRRGEEIAAIVTIEELKLLQKIEDRMDIEDAIKAINEPGENIPSEEFWKELGL
jgi:prevent-host-death family protein